MSPEVDLLRRFEPLLRLNRGEAFCPMNVDVYVRACSLWVQHPGMDAECLVPQGELTLEKLAEPRQGGTDIVYFLRFIEPPDILKFIAYIGGKGKRSSGTRGRFRIGAGRLARVGYSSRFADLLFSLSLLLRGRVPGDASAAASAEYKDILAANEHYVYHGRVVQQAGWVVLQYWFFYAFNNWRSGFFGVNDHEADWEMVNVYLYQAEDGEYRPEWVAYASHDFSGDDLRRRWDDPELQKVGEHPVIYAGAGSHASYYSSGEYLAEIELPFLTPLARWLQWVTAFWGRILGLRDQNDYTSTEADDQEHMPREERAKLNIFRVPFVDYAHGDGVVIGPGGDHEWGAPLLIGPQAPGWVQQYAGLWGLYARDPISGENAPAGPMYNRDGTIRRAWYDPLGWAGLDKMPPPDQALPLLRQEQAALRQKLTELADRIEQKSQELARMGVLDTALRASADLVIVERDQQEHLQAASHELAQLRACLARDEKCLMALEAQEKRLMKGECCSPRAHIRRAHMPASDSEMRVNRTVELWAALSIGLLMIGFVGLALFYRQHLILGLVVMVSLFVFIESGFRRQLPQLINSVAIGLAVASALIITFHFFWWIVVLGVLFAGIYILWENMHELIG